MNHATPLDQNPFARTTADWRARWRALGSATFLNFAGHAAMPCAAVDAALRAAEAKARPFGGDGEDFFAPGERARQAIASLIGGTAERIALTTGASAGAALVALGRAWSSNDEILLYAGDFPNHAASWLSVHERTGARVRIVPRSGPFLDARDVIAAMSPATRLISVSHLGFNDGSLLDAESLGAACREAGVSLMLDVSQSAGAAPIHVEAIGADYVIGVGYKYLLGPWGVGFLWMSKQGKAALADTPWNWLSQDVASFGELDYCAPTPCASVRRWDSAQMAGPYNLNLAAFNAALDLVREAGPEHVLAHGRGLIDRLFSQLPVQCLTASPREATRRGAFGCFKATTRAATSALFEHLRAHDFVLSLRAGVIRVAPHLINDERDIDRLSACVRAWAVQGST